MDEVLHPSPAGRAMVEIDYTNHRGERATRVVCPGRLEFAASEWHPEPQWLLVAFDQDRQAERSFAMKDVHAWRPFDPGR